MVGRLIGGRQVLREGWLVAFWCSSKEGKYAKALAAYSMAIELSEDDGLDSLDGLSKSKNPSSPDFTEP